MCIIGVNFIPVIVNIFLFKKDRNLHIKFFLLLVSLFLNNLSSGLLPDENFPIPIISQNILAYTVGLITTIYYYYYIHSEYHIRVFKYLNIQIILIVFVLHLIIFFILPYTITNDLIISRRLYIIFPIIITMLIFCNTAFYEWNKYNIVTDTAQKFRILSGIMAFLSILSLPVIILLLGDKQEVEQTFYTIGGLFLLISYYLPRTNSLQEEATEADNIMLSSLSNREKEIFNLVVNQPDLNFEDYSSQLYITKGAFSSQISSIYKKLEVKNLKEFKEKYRKRKVNADVR